MNHKSKLMKDIDTAKEHLENVAEPIKWMADAQPGKINAIFLATAINDDEGNGVTLNGTAIGDLPSMVAAIVGALDSNPELAEVFIIALNEWQEKDCRAIIVKLNAL